MTFSGLVTAATTTASTILTASLTPLITGLLAGAGGLVGVGMPPGVEADLQESIEVAAAPDVGIEITDVVSHVPADGSFVVEVRITPEDLAQRPEGEGFELVATIFEPLEDAQALGWDLTEPMTRTQPVAITDLPDPVDGRYRLEIKVRSDTEFDDQARIHLPEAGVHPVAIELRSSDGAWASARTNLIRLPVETSIETSTGDGSEDGTKNNTENNTADAGLPLAIVLAISPAEGLTVAEATPLLARYPNLPLTVLLQEGVQTQLAADDTLRENFAQALGGRPVLTPPGLRLDPSALTEVGLGHLYRQVHDEAVGSVSDLGLTPSAGTALVETRLTEQGAAALIGHDIDLVVSPEIITATNGSIQARGRTLNVMSFNRELNTILTAAESGPVRANRILSYLALLAEEDSAPVVFGGPVSGRDLTTVFDPLFDGLSQPGAPQPVLLSEVNASPFPIRPAERPAQDLRPVAELLTGIEAKIATYEDFRRPANPLGSASADYFRRQTLSALTIDRNPDSRQRALAALDNDLEVRFDAVSMPEAQSVTMAAQSAIIPLIIESRADGPRDLVLRFGSDKLVVAQHEQKITVEPGVSSIDLEVEARSLGLSTLEVALWTPDGSVQLARSRFTVRSTGIPGLSLAITLSAFGLLGLWWLLDSRRKRDRAPARGETGGRTVSTSVG